MKRYISQHERPFYTYMREIISALDGDHLSYKWLITSVEACPNKSGKHAGRIGNGEDIILSTAELLKMLTADDFQWIWAVFSAIPAQISDEDILRYPLPSADNNDIYKDDTAIIQHPLAEAEIVAVDSSSVFLVTENERMVEQFIRLFPLAQPNYQ